MNNCFDANVILYCNNVVTMFIQVYILLGDRRPFFSYSAQFSSFRLLQFLITSLQAEKLCYESSTISIDSECQQIGNVVGNGKVAFQLQKICKCLNIRPNTEPSSLIETSSEVVRYITRHIEAAKGECSISRTVPKLLTFDSTVLSSHYFSNYALENTLRQIESSFYEVGLFINRMFF